MPKVTQQVPPKNSPLGTNLPQTQTSKSNSTSNGVSGKKSIWDRISGIGFDPNEGINCLLYGKSGTGKTTIWATFPGPILAVVCSGGNNPGELRSIDTPEYRKKISQVVLHQSKELDEVVDKMKELDCPYATLVLDHLSGLEDKVLAEILGMDQLPAQKYWGLADRDQYGQCQQQCKELMRRVLALRCNIVIVAHERLHDAKDETGSGLIQPSIGAGVMPKFAPWVYGAIDYIGQTCLVEEEIDKVTIVGEGKTQKKITTKVKTGKLSYCLRTGPSTLFATKFRKPKGTELPEFIVNPTYDLIMGLIKSAAK